MLSFAELRDSQSLGLLRFPSPQLRQQTRLPKFPTVPLPVDFDDNVGDRIVEEMRRRRRMQKMELY